MCRTDVARRCVLIAAWIVIIHFSTSPSAAAQTFDFVKIADENTVVPGTSGITFGSLSQSALDGHTVAFMGVTAGPGDGVYKYETGSLTRVADEFTILPGISNNAFFFGFVPSLDASDVAFAAESFTSHGIFKQTASGK